MGEFMIDGILNISPKIYPENRDYDCFWGIANRNNQYSIIDTISYERDLNYVVTLNTGSYTLRFCAKDRETGIFSYTEYNLSVETDMSTGWWVLKGGENGTDVDIFTDEKKIADVVYSYNGRALAGQPVDLAYTTDYKSAYKEADALVYQLLLVAKHLVERTLAHAQSCSHVIHTHLAYALLSKHFASHGYHTVALLNVRMSINNFHIGRTNETLYLKTYCSKTVQRYRENHN